MQTNVDGADKAHAKHGRHDSEVVRVWVAPPMEAHVGMLCVVDDADDIEHRVADDDEHRGSNHQGNEVELR